MNGLRNRSEGVIEEKCSNARCGTSSRGHRVRVRQVSRVEGGAHDHERPDRSVWDCL
jgi:hypothetical protein